MRQDEGKPTPAGWTIAPLRSPASRYPSLAPARCAIVHVAIMSFLAAMSKKRPSASAFFTHEASVRSNHINLRWAAAFALNFLTACSAGAAQTTIPASQAQSSQVSSADQSTLGANAPYALSSAQSTITGSQQGWLAQHHVIEMPKSVFSFVDSIGVGADFQYHNSPYDRMPLAYERLIEQSHIRNVRGQSNGDPGVTAIYNRMCAMGVRHTVGFGLHVTASDIAEQINRYRPGCVAAVEPMNEYDAYALNGAHPDPHWIAKLLAEQRTIWRTVKSNPAWANITVMGPSLASLSRYALLGNLEGISDVGNQHDGTCDGSPLTTHYKNIAQRIKYIRVSYPTKPIWVGETTYSNDPRYSRCGVAKEVAAKYVPRTFLERFNLGQPHTFYNELSDDLNKGTGWGLLGLTDTTAQPHPAYTALRSLLGVFPDDRSSRALQPLRYAIGGGQIHDVHHTLLQGNDGAYYLILWLEVDSWDVYSKRPLYPAPREVTLSLPSSLRSAVYFTPSSDFDMTQRTLTINGSLHVRVSDSPSVLVVK